MYNLYIYGINIYILSSLNFFITNQTDCHTMVIVSHLYIFIFFMKNDHSRLIYDCLSRSSNFSWANRTTELTSEHNMTTYLLMHTNTYTQAMSTAFVNISLNQLHVLQISITTNRLIKLI